jgi:hypothetical protein
MGGKMQANISARGYTSVILVMNMKRFVEGEESRKKFETLRGKAEFRDLLRLDWPKIVPTQNVFIPMVDFKQRQVEQAGKAFSSNDRMSTEEIGFATGIFRSLMLEEYTFPTYAVDKSKVQFSQELETNFQFKTLFKRAWDRWDIFIRPSSTGFFVIRLTEHYQEKPRSFLALAQDVLKLQESLDIPSAQRWLEHSREKYSDNPQTFAEKERSVSALLEWVGSRDGNAGELLYYPIQWKIAMEVAARFVTLVGTQILQGTTVPIKLTPPEASLSIPLHDSYVVHHFDEILASPSAVNGTNEKNGTLIQVSLNDIRNSHQLKRALTNLAEGSVLRRVAKKNNSGENNANDDMSSTQALEKISYFPSPRWSLVDNILEQNQASWNDEFSLFSSRTAILFPSQEWREHEMSVSTVPSATLRVKYARYWGAIERMIEFIVEIRVLAQLVESESYSLLGEIAQTVHETRSLLFTGNIKMDKRLPNLVTRAAYLRFLAALTQSLSHPQLWSRAEYASNKANYLLNQLGVPTILDHIERNITSINSVVDHVDELYLADLSEKSNDVTTLLSVALAAASLTLTVLMLPSFWADTLQSFSNKAGELTNKTFAWGLIFIGTLISIILIYLAFVLLKPAYKRRKQVAEIIEKLLNGNDEK